MKKKQKEAGSSKVFAVVSNLPKPPKTDIDIWRLLGKKVEVDMSDIQEVTLSGQETAFRVPIIYPGDGVRRFILTKCLDFPDKNHPDVKALLAQQCEDGRRVSISR